MAFEFRLGVTGTEIFEGAWAERWYRFIRSSVLPLARMIFCVCFGIGADGGESARQRMAEAWALKRKVSANSTSSLFLGEIVAVTPCRTRSYDPAMIWIVRGYFGVEDEVDFIFLLGTSATAVAESPFVCRFRLAMSCGDVELLFEAWREKFKFRNNFCRVAADHVRAPLAWYLFSMQHSSILPSIFINLHNTVNMVKYM